jgi:hypothetical protein
MLNYQFPPLLDPSESASEDIWRLHDWWLSIREPGDRYPKWSNVDIVDLKDCFGWLMVYGLEPDLSDAEYRLVGSMIVERAGYDLTGSRVSEQTYTLTPELVLFNLRRVCERSGCSLQTNPLDVNKTGRTRSFERLWMPFSEDQSTIDRLLIFHHNIKELGTES